MVELTKSEWRTIALALDSTLVREDIPSYYPEDVDFWELIEKVERNEAEATE